MITVAVLNIQESTREKIKTTDVSMQKESVDLHLYKLMWSTLEEEEGYEI